MSINMRNYVIALFGFDHVIRSVPVDRWDDPSPCAGWTARDVAGHAMGVAINIAARAADGPQVDVFDRPGSIAGDDPYATFYAARNRLLEVMDCEGVLQRVVRSSLGALTVDAFLGQMMPDMLIHTWDLARATGGDERLDAELVPAAHATLQARGEAALRSPGRFDPVVDSPGAGGQSLLLSFTGRQA